MKMNAKKCMMSKTPKFKIMTGSNPALGRIMPHLVHTNPGLVSSEISFTKIGSQFTCIVRLAALNF